MQVRTPKEIELEEKAKHTKLMAHINAVLTTVSGQELVKYLFENFSPMADIPPFCKGEELIERVAFTRTGVAIYNIISEANPDMAGVILGKIKKERLRYEQMGDNNQDGSNDEYE